MSDEKFNKTPKSLDHKLAMQDIIIRDTMNWRNRAREVGIALTPSQVRKLEKSGSSPLEVFQSAERREKYQLTFILFDSLCNWSRAVVPFVDKLSPDLQSKLWRYHPTDNVDELPPESEIETVEWFEMLEDVYEDFLEKNSPRILDPIEN